MQYFVVMPKGYGQLDSGTIRDNASREIVSLSLTLEYTPKDELMQVGGDVYLVSCTLAEALTKSNFRKFDLENVTVNKSPQFHLMNKNQYERISDFKWLKVLGVGLKDDLGLYNNRFVVSASALVFFKQFAISEWEVVKVEDFQFSWEDRKKLLYERARKKLKQIGPKQAGS